METIAFLRSQYDSIGFPAARNPNFASMSFGFGYESRSSDRPSVQTARSEFLNIVAEIQPEVVFRLFRSCYLPFSELLELKEEIIAASCREIDTNLPKEAYILRQHILRS